MLLLKRIFYFLLLCHSTALLAQNNNFNFHKLSIENGLHDGIIRCIGQDKFGYIWIGSVGALNRFDGKMVTKFTKIPGDSTSAYGSQPRSMHTDKNGRLWIGTETGLMEFDYNSGGFKKIKSFENNFIGKIASVGDSTLYLATRKGFIRYNTNTGSTYNFTTSTRPEHQSLYKNSVNDIDIFKNKLYLACHEGLVIMDLTTDSTMLVPIAGLKEKPIAFIAVDAQGNMWIGTHLSSKLSRLHADYKTFETYDRFLSSAIQTQPMNVMGIIVDNKNRVWVATAIDGLLKFNEGQNGFIKYLHNSVAQSSPSGNQYRSIFKDNAGLVWLGGDGNGVNYFNPDHDFFKTLFPFPDRLDERSRSVARGITEDKWGNLWMGNHDGVTRYSIKNNSYSIWRNDEGKSPVIYSNLIRSLLCDDDNNIWIGTGSGVNRYNNTTNQMEFVPQKDLPLSFYNSINKDRSGNIWFCTNDTASVYWYSPAEKKYSNISQHPQLNKYKGYAPASYVLEDSRNRLWISFARKGVVMYNKNSLQTKAYAASEEKGKGIAGNQVVDIKEDKNGVIWLSSFNGISGIDVEHDSILNYDNKNGLVGNFVSPLVIDNANRIWLGVTGGLMMLDAGRKQFTRFGLSDGLPTLGFPEHAGINASNGDIIMPSNNGFIRFNPAEYKAEKADLNFYISDITIPGRSLPAVINENNTVLKLLANENSFTFNLVALNYTNPSQTWFAYRLKGFEKEWHYTQDAKAVYTNISGGNYSFEYKAANNNFSWNEIIAKDIAVQLKTKYYNSIWFRFLIAAIIALLLYFLYRYRNRQQQQLFVLSTKTQHLEKEKALVMYENLKQQLNPHFLFNSLSSLRSLIRTNTPLATDFLDGLSKTYRYLLRSGDTELVNLRDELDFVQIFVQLQKTRFDEGLQLTVDIPEELMNRKIAPVTIQGLIENAIKHNMVDEESPLHIEIFADNENIIVRNNLQKIAEVETSNKKGLAALKTLYSYYTDKPLTIQEDEKYFTIIIPLI